MIDGSLLRRPLRLSLLSLCASVTITKLVSVLVGFAVTFDMSDFVVTVHMVAVSYSFAMRGEQRRIQIVVGMVAYGRGQGNKSPLR
jgi:hypothetical protein